ncbi:MAG: glycosyltransferase family 1 protein [Bacteroidaceae bacterium]|nr:glycosyltransferase family 1 protein [Bacteroidaceae bacterium]
MKILLFGEYSNVHWTLAEGLRALGHNVCVVSDGDRWKDYPRDITLRRRWRTSPCGVKRALGAALYLLRLLWLLPRLRGYDVVQLINPVFLDLKARRIAPFYRYLRRHNRCMVLGAFGIDKYWVLGGLDCHTFRYSDFNIGSELRHNEFTALMQREWLGEKGELNDLIARDCDAIVSGLYENDACYRPHFPQKLRYIPFPIDLGLIEPRVRSAADGVVRFFVGVQRERSAYKGTDIMLSALRRVEAEHPDRCQITVVESVPFREYIRLLGEAHVQLDQLYSYTPSMNSLQAMAQGLVVVSGGEPENYAILSEDELRPIINVQPTEQSVYKELTDLVEHPEQVETLSRQSIEYVRRHHSHTSVARRYLDLYSSLIL